MYTAVYPTQKVYRVLVEAMSHPGEVFQFPGICQDDPWSSSLLAVAHTLFDHEVTFAVVDGLPSLEKEIYDSTKARRVSLEKALYVIVSGNRSAGNILRACPGSSIYPESGATVIYSFEEGDEDSCDLTGIELSGPGIRDSIHPRLAGLDAEEFEVLRQVNSEYPLGVDAIFLRGDAQVMCIPRSTRIRLK